jgi:type II secretory pathway pseudopilin PulG
MGQQQLLLIMLGVIIIGMALAVGLIMFNANSIEQKRNEIINECTLLASEAQLYYRKLKEHGGGGRSFTGWTVPPQYASTEVGSITAVTSANQVILTGTGNEIVTGSDSIKVQITVYPNTIETIIIH